ncbi:putative Transmembrane protein [Quillaja saponaria]|uniref:Transmembrane protein n=1 Tax=Quillaja saponaria TaxID=32244 RepID=A0AAD7M2T5_QUISA|nr:putative Transmembrane protein [Quillaja saponaria]
MGGKKSWFFKKLRKESWRLKFLGSALKRKRLNLPVSFMKDVIFKVVSVFEAIVLVMNLAFFYLCCGCSF